MRQLVEQYQSLLSTDLGQDTVLGWLDRWDSLDRQLLNIEARLSLETLKNTDPKAPAHSAYSEFVQGSFAEANHLKAKLVTKFLDYHSQDSHIRDLQEKMAVAKAREMFDARLEEILGEDIAAFRRIRTRVKVAYAGEELPFNQAVAKVETLTDEGERIKLYRACSEGRERFYPDELEVHRTLVEKRQTMARGTGYSNYAEFRFGSGFSKADADQALELARAVRTHVGALLKQVRTRWSKKHYPLKPWRKIKELAVAPPPNFWTDSKVATNHLSTTLNALNPGFGPIIERIFEQGNVDIERRPNKAQITRMFYFPTERASFVFHSSGWGTSGYADLLHELGHVVHGEVLDHPGAHFFLVNPDYPSGEFVAFTVEYLGLRLTHSQNGSSIDEEYESAELDRMLTNFVHMAAMEEICHYIYRSPKLPDTDSIDGKWLEVASYAEGLDWSEDLDRLKRQWLHYFVVGMPFETLDYLEGLTASLIMVAEYLRDPVETPKLLSSLAAQNLGMEAVFDRLGQPYPLREKTVTALCDLLVKRHKVLAS